MADLQKSKCEFKTIGLQTGRSYFILDQRYPQGTLEELGALNELLAKNVTQAPGATREADQPFPRGEVYGRTQSYLIPLEGKKSAVDISQSDYSFEDQSNNMIHYVRTSVTLCPSVPDKVTILDTTIGPDGKTAIVIAQLAWKLTPLAATLNESGLINAQRLASQNPVEMKLAFRKLDATGWRLEGVTL